MNQQISRTTLLTYGDGADYWSSIIGDRCPGVDVINGSLTKGVTDDFKKITCLIGWRFPGWAVEALPNLQWIQSISVGVAEFLENPDISSDVLITNTKGLFGDSVAEYVIWALLTLSRRFHAAFANQAKRRWRQVSGPGLKHQTLGIVGMGNIGQTVAIRAKAFDMTTIGVVRDSRNLVSFPNVDDVMPIGELDARISEFDALVLCVPRTASTKGIINREIVAKMKSGSVIINVSRAGIVDESVVSDALVSGKLAGAAIDVFENEPLGRSSRLWHTNNLLVTPHMAALSSDYRSRVADLICENVVRFTEERPLLNVVDRSKGY